MSCTNQALIANLYPEAPVLARHDWYALETRVRFERKICQQVQAKRHEAYVPVSRERRRWSDRSQVVEMPLFPGYVFVRAISSPLDRLSVLQTAGAYGFVSFNGVIACIPDEQVQNLQRLEMQNMAWSSFPFLRCGQRIRVCGGCLDGLEGILVSEHGRRLVISIEPMARSIAIDIEDYDVQLI